MFRAQAQGGPGGAVLFAQLGHGLGDGLGVQIGVQAVDDLQGAPGHAVGGEGGVLLPFQHVPEGPGNQQAAARPEEEGEDGQHGQGHLDAELHGSTSRR